MKKFLDMNVCLYKLYKCVHDRVRRFYTSTGLTYGHVAFSSISSTILCEKHVRRRDTRTQYGTKEETGISPDVERVREIGERERKRDRHHGLHFVSLLLCLQSAHLMKTFSVSFSAIRKGFLEPGGSLRRLFIRRVLLNKNTLVFQISGKESTFFGWWVLLHCAGILYPASAWSTSSTTWAPWGAAALGGRVGRRRGLDLPQAAGCCSSAGPRPGGGRTVRRW